MAWLTRGYFDWITNNDVLEGLALDAFTLKPGQSVPADNNFMTISEANAKLDIVAVSGNGNTWIRWGQIQRYYWHNLNDIDGTFTMGGAGSTLGGTCESTVNYTSRLWSHITNPNNL